MFIISLFDQVPEQLSFLQELWEHGQVTIWFLCQILVIWVMEQQFWLSFTSWVNLNCLQPATAAIKTYNCISLPLKNIQVSRVSPEERDLACDACEAAVQVVRMRKILKRIHSNLSSTWICGWVWGYDDGSMIDIQVIDLMLLGVDESGIESALSSEDFL